MIENLQVGPIEDEIVWRTRTQKLITDIWNEALMMI